MALLYINYVEHVILVTRIASYPITHMITGVNTDPFNSDPANFDLTHTLIKGCMCSPTLIG